jgi:cholesterol oxidase
MQAQDQAPTTPQLRFTERMRGYFSTQVTTGFRAGWVQGRADGSSIECTLTIDFQDLEETLAHPDRPARVSGTVEAPLLSPYPLTVEEGEFILLERDEQQVETWHMRYRMRLQARDGHHYRLDGFKVLHDRPGFDAWSDTTTLYTTLSDGNGNPVGAGILRIRLADFLRQLRTITVRNVIEPGRREAYLLAFVWLFARSLLRIYGGPLDEAHRFPTLPAGPACDQPPAPPPPAARPLRLPVAESRWCGRTGGWHEGTEPGRDAWLRLTRYRGGSKGPVVLAGGFGMSSSSFVTTTIAVNLPEYLVEHGYDVWLFDYRASIDLPSACGEFTVDDIATRDWPVAVAEVLRVTGTASVQAVGHCVGSVSLLMAMLAGMPRVRSAVCAQFTTHLVNSPLNRVKAALHLSEALHAFGTHRLAPNTRFDVPDVLLDLGLRALPMASEERCGQAVCRWINAVYGCTHRHAQLNDATHQALNRMFGVGNIKSLEHLALMTRRGLAVDHQGRDVYLPHRERLRLPILLLQGERNYIFSPEGSARTLRWLQNGADPSLYKRAVLPGYAHLDAIVGRDAARDVYPVILGHLEATA